MSDIKYRLYAFVHYSVKALLGRRTLKGQHIFDFPNRHLGADVRGVEDLWRQFTDDSVITGDDEFNGMHYAGYILEAGKWCLPSWIWTNAAIIRVLASDGRIDLAKKKGALLASRQLDCGGWIVRNDYDSNGAIPMLAPNDSAYIANNAFLTLYKSTHDVSYLGIAEKCAAWIMETSRKDYMVYTGYNLRDGLWDKRNIIVDVGFTGGLFANLYMLTGKKVYRDFLLRFSNRYIELFYNPAFKGFATSIDCNNQQQGGFFGRGQAWALEGLIPAYKATGSPVIKEVIEHVVNTLVRLQNLDGSWSYNLSRRNLGNDCKGVPVIAKALADWYEITGDCRLIESVSRAYGWCCRHTCQSGEATGGIFSFCTEGGVVKDLYASCAFVYSAAYALELHAFLSKIK